MRDRDILKQIWQEFNPILDRVIIADALFKLLIFLTLTPLMSWLYSRIIWQSGSSAVSNTDIIAFLTSPLVLISLFIAGVLSLAITYAENAALMQIVFAHQRDSFVSYRHIFRHLKKQAVDFVGLGAVIIGRLLLIFAPLVITAGLLYFFNFREHDINYYLQVRPPEFWLSIAIITPVLLVTLGVFAYYWVSWVFALPAVLFENKPFREAIPYSRELIANSWWRIARLVYGGAGLLTGLLIIAIAVVIGLGGLLIQVVSDSTVLLLLISGLMIFVDWLFTVLAGFIITTYSIILRTYLYDQAVTSQGITIPYQPDHKDRIRLRLTRVQATVVMVAGSVVILMIGVYLLAETSQAISRPTTVTAHRGSSAVAPPNTLAAVQQAIEDGADYAEIDVQETADGVIILNHDKDYLLVAGVPRDVHEVTYEETQAFDVGSSFSADFANERVATLAEVLDVAKGNINVNIELKYYGQDVRLAERVINVVREKDMADNVLIMSLHYEGVEEVRELAPDITAGFLVSDLTFGDLTELDVDFLAVSSNLATPSFVSQVHFAGKEVFVWTINDGDDVPPYLYRGVDSIITDYPVIIREQIELWEQISASEKLLLAIADRFDN